jgi:hypothetical protein
MSSDRLLNMESALAVLRGLPPRAALARETQRLWRAEVASSVLLAGSPLAPGEVDALLDRGLARGDHPLDAYILVRAYAEASHWVAEHRSRQAGDPRPLVSVDDVRHLNALVAGGSSPLGGAWRLGNPPPEAGIVAPAAWLVHRELTTLIDRVGRGPGNARIALWVAWVLGRFARIRPFADGNGRTTRLLANLLLRRLDIPPIVYERPERRRYAGAVAAAEADNPQPLANLIAGAVLRACDRIEATARSAATDPLTPLRALADDAYESLSRAARRGRLRTVLRGTRYFTTRAWIAEYRETVRRRHEPPRDAQFVTRSGET